MLHCTVFKVAKMEHLCVIAMSEVSERTTEVIFGLSVLIPECVSESTIAAPLALCTALTLLEFEVRSIFSDDLAALLDFLITLVRIVFVMVISDCIEKMSLAPLLEFLHERLDPLRISLCESKCIDMGIRNDLTENLSRTHSKVCSLLDCIA